MPRSENVRSLLVRTLYASLPLAFALSTTAQQVGDWRPVRTNTAPPARTGFKLVELPGPFAEGQLLMIGGGSADPLIRDYYWNGLDWVLSFTASFQRRDDPAVTKFGDDALLLYGGSANGQVQSDTWISNDGFTWNQPTTTSPGVLTRPSMAYDPQSDRCVLIGQGTSGLFETWFFDLSQGWTAGPTMAVAEAQVITDSVRREVLLFADEQAHIRIDALSGDEWSNVGQTPFGVRLGEVAFDHRRARVVLTQPTSTLDTWEWDGASVRHLTPPSGTFVPPVATGLGYYGVRNETVYVRSNGTDMEVLRHLAEAGPQAHPFGSACTGIDAVRLAAGSPQPGQTHQLQLETQIPPLPFVAAFSVLGTSNVSFNGVPLPLPVTGCLLRVEPAVVTYLGSSLPVSQLITVPPTASLVGERYQAQMATLHSFGQVRTSRALDVQIGNPIGERVIEESFDSNQFRDPVASGDWWNLGQVQPAIIGGDGRHGSFDATIGVEIEPGVYEWNTDNMVIPASMTLTGVEEIVNDGRFEFSDLHVPAGVTVQFVGSHPVHLFVRGEATIDGTLSVDAPGGPSAIATTGPAAGQRVSTFDARQMAALANGQPGGLGGPGGARGGNGGDECTNQGPTIVNGIDVTSGQPGEDLALAAGHAYAAQVVDTGGRGSELMPASGVLQAPIPLIGNVYTGYFSAGGGGGGYGQAGTSPSTPTHVNPTYTISAGPAAVGGQSFSPLPVPAGVSSLDHLSIGGSGGGGGGSHGYGLIGIVQTLPEQWMAGHAGTGGGGVLAVRAGGFATVGGVLSARGGDGALITGTDPASPVTNGLAGISSPGGGGSGGTVLVQSGLTARVLSSGTIDTRGGFGGRVGSIGNPLQNMTGAAGDGAHGFYRVEGANGALVLGGTVPAFVSSQNAAVLGDRDSRSGSRSVWLLPASGDLPVYKRYELLVSINGLPVLFSDDPSVSPVAADNPGAGVQVRFQGARIDAFTGQALPGTEGPWRSYLRVGEGSVNADRAQAVRFDIAIDTSVAQIGVLNLRIVWE